MMYVSFSIDHTCRYDVVFSALLLELNEGCILVGCYHWVGLSISEVVNVDLDPDR
jgi:hypothetical protein